MADLTREQIEKRKVEAERDLANHKQFENHSNAELRIGSKAFIEHAEEEIALCTLALVGLAVQPRPIEEAPKDGTRILALWGGEWVITNWVHDRFGYNGWKIPSGMVVKANDRSAWQPVQFTALPEPKQ